MGYIRRMGLKHKERPMWMWIWISRTSRFCQSSVDLEYCDKLIIRDLVTY
jgi:hypothetical protein